MTVRLMQLEDLEQVRAIHKEFFDGEFILPFDRLNRLLDKYVVVDDFGKIIMFGSLELALEAVVVTNKNMKPRDRAEAFGKILQCLDYLSSAKGFDDYHVTAQDPKVTKHLKKTFGFKTCKGDFLYRENK